MQARLEALERQAGQMASLPAQGLPKPEVAPAALETLTEFQREMASQTRPVPRDYVRNDPGFNYPMAWYSRPDGDIVQLQGDPNNRALYVDLGFHLLTRDEVERWESVERAKVVAEQRRKAAAITAYRRLEVRIPSFVLDDETNGAFASMSTDEIVESYKEACHEAGIKPHLPKPKPEPKTTRSTDANLSGIETGSVDPRLAGLIDGTRTRGNGRALEMQPGHPRNFA
jgi:hypothetical protein